MPKTTDVLQNEDHSAGVVRNAGLRSDGELVQAMSGEDSFQFQPASAKQRDGWIEISTMHQTTPKPAGSEEQKDLLLLDVGPLVPAQDDVDAFLF